MIPLMLVSTIIPTYNRAVFLGAAIDSVLSQMVPGDELIVVDDGSEDGTPDVLRKYGSRVTALVGGHGGAGRARNIGIAHARNDLVAFLDSDDVWLPQKLALQRAFMERRPEVLFSFTNFEVELRDGSVRSRYLDLWQRDHVSWDEGFGRGRAYSDVAPLPEGVANFQVHEVDLYPLQLTGYYVLTDTLVARRKDAGDALRFAEDLKTYEDLECFYRLSQRGRAAYLDVETARQRDHPHDRLSQRDQLEKIDARIALVRRVWGADAEFLQDHAGAYRQALDRLLVQRAGLLLSQGTHAEARLTLAEVTSPPLHLALLSALPPGLARAALTLRRRLGRRHG